VGEEVPEPERFRSFAQIRDAIAASRVAGVANLQELAGGLWRTQLLSVAARLGIADRLAGGPSTAAELAAETGADADALFRVLRALASLGVFSQDAEDRFGPTEVSERLRPGAPGSPHARAALYGEAWWWAAAGGLYDTVMTGEPAPGKLVDITMLLITGGRVRTRDEYADLLARGGFRLASVAPTAAGTDVIAAEPV
jgi:hypothetical protein